MKAIETVYKGYRFRSRLEARWAVFFDALGLHWEYEKEGYDLGGAGKYLPDFWLPQVRMWAEVKPDRVSINSHEWDCLYRKATELAKRTECSVLLLLGVPENKPYIAIDPPYRQTGPDEFGYPPPEQQDDECSEVEYCLTMYHNYPLEEGRFYCMPGDHDPGGDAYWDDTERAASTARSARFEYGESGRFST